MDATTIKLKDHEGHASIIKREESVRNIDIDVLGLGLGLIKA